MKDIYIIGAGGHGREIVDTIQAINADSSVYRIAGFIDDDESKHGKYINEIEILGGTDFLLEMSKSTSDIGAIIAVAGPQSKEKIARKLEGSVNWENIIHPTALISPNTQIGKGNNIQALSIINANARIMDHCLINACTDIGHETVIENYVSIMKKCDITGNCHLHERVFVASSVCIVPGCRIAIDVTLGAGSVVTKSVETPGITAIGNPARIKGDNSRFK